MIWKLVVRSEGVRGREPCGIPRDHQTVQNRLLVTAGRQTAAGLVTAGGQTAAGLVTAGRQTAAGLVTAGRQTVAGLVTAGGQTVAGLVTESRQTAAGLCGLCGQVRVRCLAGCGPALIWSGSSQLRPPVKGRKDDSRSRLSAYSRWRSRSPAAGAAAPPSLACHPSLPPLLNLG